MKTMLVMGGFLATVTLSTPSFADEAGFQIQSGDTVKSVLERSAGQSVGLRLKGGDELKGKVAKVGDKVAQLGELSGREFFDAVVQLDSIQAVIVKARSK